jgi:hypothetical protein
MMIFVISWPGAIVKSRVVVSITFPLDVNLNMSCPLLTCWLDCIDTSILFSSENVEVIHVLWVSPAEVGKIIMVSRIVRIERFLDFIATL